MACEMIWGTPRFKPLLATVKDCESLDGPRNVKLWKFVASSAAALTFSERGMVVTAAPGPSGVRMTFPV